MPPVTRLVRVVLCGLALGVIVNGCADSRRSPLAPSALPSVGDSSQLANTVIWECGSGSVESGGQGWTFPPADGCQPRSMARSASVVSGGLVSVAPTNLRFSVDGSTVRLEWNMAPDGVTGFQLEAGSASGLANLATFSTNSPATALVVLRVPNGTFFVRVRGVGADGIAGPASNEIVVVVGPSTLQPPGAPTSLTRQVSGNQVVLTWSPGGGGAVSTWVSRRESRPGATDVVVFTTGNPTPSLTVTGVPDGLYYARVRGRNPAGTGPPSPDRAVGVNRIEPEICGNNLDDNGDGRIDEDCDEVCGDGVDNDGDGQVDEACVEICNDGIDNNRNGQIDEGCPCTYNVSRAPGRFPFSGGTFDISVTPNRDGCTWSARSAAPFVTVDSGGSGAGIGTARFRVANNPDAAPRNGRVHIDYSGGPANIDVSQDANTIIDIIDEFEESSVVLPPPPPGEPAPSLEVTTGRGGRPNAGAGPPVTVVGAPPPPTTSAPPGRSLRSFVIKSETPVDRVVVSVDIPPAENASALDVATEFHNIRVTPPQTVFQVTIAVPTTTTSFAVQFAAARSDNIFGPYSSQTVTTVPPPIPPCTFDVSQPSPASLGAAAGFFDVTITTQVGCLWSAGALPSSSSFVSVASGSSDSGAGTGTVRFNVAASTGAARNADVRFAWTAASIDRTVQQGTGCSYSVSAPSPATIPAAGGTFSVNVTTGAECTWTAAPSAASSSFVTVATPSGGSGTGPTSATFNVAAHTGSSQRTGTVTVAGMTVNVTQNGACNYSVSAPSPGTIPAAGGTFSVNVTAGAECTWTAAPSDASSSFITVSAPSGGTGTGSNPATFSVAAYTGSTPRTGTVSVAGTTVTVNQNPGCNYVVPTSQNLSSMARTLNGAIALTVEVEAGCAWDAAIIGGSGFISPVSGTVLSGPGTRTMRFDVQANRTTSDRSATLRVSWPGQNVRNVSIVQVHPTARIHVDWNTIVDIDLKVVEPGGNLIHNGDRIGGSDISSMTMRRKLEVSRHWRTFT